MEVIIERAKLTDLPQVSKLFDAYRVFYKQHSAMEAASEFLAKRIGNSESVIFYARTNAGKYIGFTQLYPGFSSLTLEQIWILSDLYVAVDSRKHGVGTSLLNAAKDYARKTGAGGISLETALTNTIAQKLYESLGYEKDTEFLSFFLKL